VTLSRRKTGIAASWCADSSAQRTPAGFENAVRVRITRSGVTTKSTGTSCGVIGMSSFST